MAAWICGVCRLGMVGRLHPLTRCIPAWVPLRTHWPAANSSSSSAGGAARCSASQPDRLPPPDVRKLAQLAQIRVTDEEVELWGSQIGEIVQWFDQLQAVDVEGVPPALRADVDSGNTMRQDTPRVYENRESLMSEVPDREGLFVKVPKISAAEKQE